MLKSWQFWTLTLLAAICVALTATNIALYSQNRDLQTEIAGRTQYVQQSAQLEALFQEILKALAELSVRKQDAALADLLTRRGFTVTVNSPPATIPPAAQGEAKKSAKGK